MPDTDISTWETRLEVVESDTQVSVNTWVRRLMERSQQGEETDEQDEVVGQQRLEQGLLEAQIEVE
ncbi:hypothetical protein N7470_008897 [Penicillium chermesinum]|nr:hypothetical protein N7470_008897 [Penicillium chermesinum]